MNVLDNIKLDELVEAAKLSKILNSKGLLKKNEEEEKKCNYLLWVLAIIGIMAVTAAIVYAVYRYFNPDYLDDFDDDFEDDFDNLDDEDEDFFEDEEGDN